MHANQLPSICSATCIIAEQVADFIRSECGKVKLEEIDVKSLNSLVSYVDKNAEQQLVEQLQTLFPEAAFLTEEGTIETQSAPYQWIIDPLDGTTNFLHQLPFFAISIALQRENETILGVVYEVNRKECFYAWKNGGSWLNGNPIKVSTNDNMQDALAKGRMIIPTGQPVVKMAQLVQIILCLYVAQDLSTTATKHGSFVSGISFPLSEPHDQLASMFPSLKFSPLLGCKNCRFNTQNA